MLCDYQALITMLTWDQAAMYYSYTILNSSVSLAIAITSIKVSGCMVLKQH